MVHCKKPVEKSTAHLWSLYYVEPGCDSVREIYHKIASHKLSLSNVMDLIVCFAQRDLPFLPNTMMW